TLGKRATAIYLGTIALSAILFGLAVDQVYGYLGFSARAVVGQAGEIIPPWAQWTGALIILAISVGPVGRRLRSLFAAAGKSPGVLPGGGTLAGPAGNDAPCTGST
ncbi:MAG: hypothetical protein JRF52_11610, partial [Deltaproteobacteria bacterium]|nr:hypothetical protein [Deltaproteobacteria bacterium]